jgi:superfamily II DNA/RNA helicase
LIRHRHLPIAPQHTQPPSSKRLNRLCWHHAAAGRSPEIHLDPIVFRARPVGRAHPCCRRTRLHRADAVQAQAIPLILEGRDVLAGAQTGTGKTAGFTLPLLQRLSTMPARASANAQPRQRVRALILTPTRELAAQIEESVRTYGKYMSLKTTLIYGGVNINPQIDALRRGVDIWLRRPDACSITCSNAPSSCRHVEILVLDEADRMLDMGFIRDIRRIVSRCSGESARTLLFSATFSEEIRQLADGLPAQSGDGRSGTPQCAESELVAQVVHPVDRTGEARPAGASGVFGQTGSRCWSSA